MFKGIGNIASLMKTAQQMGGKMQQINDQMKAARVTGTKSMELLSSLLKASLPSSASTTRS